VPALAGRDHDGVVADVRPRQAQQVADPQPGMRAEIDRMRNVGAASRLRVAMSVAVQMISERPPL
jgi:hypothetical protein